MPPAVLRSILLLALSCSVLAQPAPERGSGWTPKQAAHARRYMIATANPLATEAGYRMLRRGGSAIDAAIAAQMVLNLVEPQSSGVGGGSLLMYHDAKRGLPVAYDGRETAPAAARPERFLDADGKPMAFMAAVVGGRSVGVPGTLRVLELAHRRHGRLPWKDLFAPAIRLAEEGFHVSPRLHALLDGAAGMDQGAVRDYFYQADGQPWPVGHLLRNPELAQTLRRVARDGADAFYRGEIAHDIVAAVAGHANAGDLTESDLAGYHAKVRRPVCGTYRVYRVCSMPPPSSGGIAVLQILGLLERFDMAALAPQSALAVHFFTEAGRLAFADRNRYIADPDYVGVPAQLTDPAYLHRRSLLIRNDASLGRAQPGDPEPSRKAAQRADDMAPELPSTSHLSVVDRYGNALSMTTTIENGFGSRIMTHGVLLNNELTDFSFLPSANGIPVANRVEGGKRPRSSMAPVIVYDQKGRVLLVVGSVGGPFIINHVVKTLIGVLDWGLDPQAAIDLPNMGSLNGPTLLERDTALAPLQPRLEALGHEVRMLELNSGVQAILRTNDGWVGGADPRREGTALGD